MRCVIIGVALLLYSSSAAAQSPCNGTTLGFDPYNPSDAAVVRQYGAAIMSQVPLSTLLQLDPYVPSQAELLRQVGGGIPAWIAYSWHPASPPPVAAPRLPECAPVAAAETPAPAPLTSFRDMLTMLERERATGPVRASAPTGTTGRHRGITISFAGQTWTSAGAAVAFRESDFVRAGESNGFPIFRLPNVKENVIYVPMTPGMVAPFRVAAAR